MGFLTRFRIPLVIRVSEGPFSGNNALCAKYINVIAKTNVRIHKIIRKTNGTKTFNHTDIRKILESRI